MVGRLAINKGRDQRGRSREGTCARGGFRGRWTLSFDSPMKFVIYLVLAALIFGVLRTHRSVGKSGAGKSRSNAIRVSAFSWLLAVIFLIAFTFLPNGPRIALVLVGSIFAISYAKFWRNRRDRLRKESAEKSHLDRMKRVN